MQIYVTGLGCINPLGLNVAESLLQLREEKDGLTHSQFLDSKYKTEKFFGEVKASTESLLQTLEPLNSYGFTRTDILALIAFKEAIAQANLSPEEVSSPTTAFISASTVGGMCMTDELYRDSNLQTEASEYVHSYNCAAHTLKIAKLYNIKGITNTINTACSSSANAIMMGMRMIRTGRAKRVIVGGVDSLSKYTVNGFNALQILSNEKCKPFDNDRSGLNLGEAAAYLVLEAEDICSNKTKIAKILGAGNTNDAFHTSSMSETADGITACINEAIADSKISSSDIDYINAHGTGTQNNDIVELTGFKAVFKTIPPYSSTKSFTGHTLGAAGALESIFSILSIVNQEIYPSLRVQNPIPNFTPIAVTNYSKNEKINTVLTNSYGFGGNCTSLIFSNK